MNKEFISELRPLVEAVFGSLVESRKRRILSASSVVRVAEEEDGSHAAQPAVASQSSMPPSPAPYTTRESKSSGERTYFAPSIPKNHIRIKDREGAEEFFITSIFARVHVFCSVWTDDASVAPHGLAVPKSRLDDADNTTLTVQGYSKLSPTITTIWYVWV